MLKKLGLDEDTVKAIKEIASSTDPTSIWRIADIQAPIPPGGSFPSITEAQLRGSGATTIGKFLLKGQGWSGGLSLNNSRAMARFSAYVGG